MLHTIALLLTIGTLAMAPVRAQERDEIARGRLGRANAPLLSPGEVVRMLDTYAIVQAQEALQLTDAQYGQFVVRLKNLQDTRRRSQQARNRIVHDLRRLAGPQATQTDENAIRTSLRALRAHDDKAPLEIRQTYDALDEVLDARQQARFRIFEERLEARKLDLLMRARQGAARGGRQ